MSWPTLPMYTEDDARDYAEGCAQRWCQAMAQQRPTTEAGWEAVRPPDMLMVPGEFWGIIHEVFGTRCGIRPDEACVRWYQWYGRWRQGPPTWIERLEADLRVYDEILAEIEACPRCGRSSPDPGERCPACEDDSGAE